MTVLVSIHQNSKIQGSEDQVAMKAQEISQDLSDVLHHTVEVLLIMVHHPMLEEVTSATAIIVTTGIGTKEETSRCPNVQATTLEIANSEWTK